MRNCNYGFARRFRFCEGFRHYFGINDRSRFTAHARKRDNRVGTGIQALNVYHGLVFLRDSLRHAVCGDAAKDGWFEWHVI
jgi:hypothetical protein